MKREDYVADRRVQRTRRTLQHALISLIQKIGYEAITVQDICEAANVGRSTFYAHFTSKDDLRKSCFEHLRRELTALQRDALATPDDAVDHRLSFSLRIFEHARDHLELHRALAGSRGGAIGLCSIREMLCDLMRNEFSAGSSTKSADGIPREVVVQYTVGAFMALLSWWLDGGAKLPPARMDAMFRRLATRGIAAEARE